MKKPFKIPDKEIEIRIKKIQKEIIRAEIDGLLIIQRVDLLYFSGTAQNGNLYIPAEGQPLLLIKRYFPRAKIESSITDIHEITSTKHIPQKIADFYGSLPSKLGLELDVMPVKEFNFFSQLFPDQMLLDGSPFIHAVRMIKSPWEIEQMGQTAELSCRTFTYIRENIRPGLSEIEFAGMFETFARTLGHGGMLRVRDYQTEGYPWHLLSGTSGGMVGLLDSPMSGEGTSLAFPCGAGNKIIAPNEPIMIDFNSVLNGYHFDETRMFAIDSMPHQALDAGKAVIEIQHAVLEKVKAGVFLEELFNISVLRAKSLGYDDYYLGPKGYKVVFIGHGIGLELIEQPIIAKGKKQPLKPGMVFALEPKMTFKDRFAAGIESVFLVTENGYRLISKTPNEIFIC